MNHIISSIRDHYIDAIDTIKPYSKEYLVYSDNARIIRGFLIGLLVGKLARTIFSSYLSFACGFGAAIGYLHFENSTRTDSNRMKLNLWNKKRIIQIATNSSKDSNKSLLLWRTTDDHNFSYSTTYNVFNLRKLAQKHSIEILPGDKILDCNEKIFDMIIIQTHSEPSYMILAPNVVLTNKSTNLLDMLKKSIKPGGIISLEACSAGRGLENIAHDISLVCPLATIYASSDICGSDTIQYNKNNIPSFKNKNNQDITRIYHNGIEKKTL